MADAASHDNTDTPPVEATGNLSHDAYYRGMAVGAAALWILALAYLAYNTSNPVVLNRIQILNAKAIVEGTYVPGEVPRLAVSKVWRGALSTDSQIPVANLSKPNPPNEPILVPLSISPTTGEYFVTSGEFWNPPEHDSHVAAKPALIAPTIYPATPAIQSDLEQLLRDVEARSRL